MRIACPCCGVRSLDEFIYHGDATVTRPDYSTPSALDDFIAYTYDRRNLAGDHQELWYHAAGCHAWLVVTRNLTTHRVLNVALARDVALARRDTAKGGA